MKRTPMKSRQKKREKIDGIDYLALCRGQNCYLRLHCCHNDTATVVPCHSNQAKHGKGMGIKASDIYTVPGCAPCHHELDQGKGLTRFERFGYWDKAYDEWQIDRSELLQGENHV